MAQQGHLGVHDRSDLQNGTFLICKQDSKQARPDLQLSPLQHSAPSEDTLSLPDAGELTSLVYCAHHWKEKGPFSVGKWSSRVQFLLGAKMTGTGKEYERAFSSTKEMTLSDNKQRPKIS